mmetsp:Transcript_107576/g.181922  ORF Transcript_107576/g.181922 Transcript_107576/m.181922 type:complete len:114 (+) Transcript_107576:1145-1486(+)
MWLLLPQTECFSKEASVLPSPIRLSLGVGGGGVSQHYQSIWQTAQVRVIVDKCFQQQAISPNMLAADIQNAVDEPPPFQPVVGCALDSEIPSGSERGFRWWTNEAHTSSSALW